MIMYRPSTILQFYKLSPSSSSSSSSSSKFLSQFRHSHSSLLPYSSSSSLPFRFHFLTNHRNENSRSFCSRGDTFFTQESVSWTTLGVSDKLSRALFNAGLGQPSLVQASCIPPIQSGNDVVIAAETGSGKTHGYLVPLIDQLCNARNDSGSAESDQQAPHDSWRKISLILCPNVTLCDQVVRMANGLCGEDGQPLLAVAAVCGRQGWPVNRPDIVVSTPAALLNNIEPNDYRRLGFLRRVKYVVFDEADMLLSGGFEDRVIRLIHMLRFDEKQLSSAEEKKTEKGNDEDNADHDVDDDIDEVDDSKHDVDSDEEEGFEGTAEDDSREIKAKSDKKRDWRRKRKNYMRSKQYIFIAATLPQNGKKTPGSVLRNMFPHADWVSGNYLHRHNPRLKQSWIEVSIDNQVEELLKAVKRGSEIKSVGPRRTIVFANTVEAVKAVAKILRENGIERYCYHKDSTLEYRAETLANFQEKGGVLVCTDSAARGLDIANISHVIQADFATSAVDFIHRVGRTARAGQYGQVTSFYTESNKDLVNAVRKAAELGESVDTAFSRKRGFRNKNKKKASAKVAALAKDKSATTAVC